MGADVEASLAEGAEHFRTEERGLVVIVPMYDLHDSSHLAILVILYASLLSGWHQLSQPC